MILKMQYGYQKTQFDADLESIEKGAKKTHPEKGINKKVTEKLTFCSFITACKSFRPIIFLGKFFAFFKRIETGHRT